MFFPAGCTHNSCTPAPWELVGAMNFRSGAMVIFLGLSYVFLFFLFMPYTAPLEHPSWWYGFFGENLFSALLWVQFAHSLSVFGAAIPVAIGIVYVFPEKKYLIGLVAASFLAVVFLFDIGRGLWLFEAPYSGFHVISATLDVIKLFLILFLAIYVFDIFKPTNKRL